jgi:hypothetical protein
MRNLKNPNVSTAHPSENALFFVGIIRWPENMRKKALSRNSENSLSKKVINLQELEIDNPRAPLKATVLVGKRSKALHNLPCQPRKNR